jgi:hypothetical protein
MSFASTLDNIEDFRSEARSYFREQNERAAWNTSPSRRRTSRPVRPFDRLSHQHVRQFIFYLSYQQLLRLLQGRSHLPQTLLPTPVTTQQPSNRALAQQARRQRERIQRAEMSTATPTPASSNRARAQQARRHRERQQREVSEIQTLHTQESDPAGPSRLGLPSPPPTQDSGHSGATEGAHHPDTSLSLCCRGPQPRPDPPGRPRTMQRQFKRTDSSSSTDSIQPRPSTLSQTRACSSSLNLGPPPPPGCGLHSAAVPLAEMEHTAWTGGRDLNRRKSY